MSRTALMDGDELAYRVAFRHEDVNYVVTKDDKFMWRTSSKEEAVESVMSRDDLEINKERVDLGPGDYQGEMDLLISRCIMRTSSTKRLLCLSGTKNFRYDLATLIPYKGTRDDTTKPFNLQIIKDYLVDLGAVSLDHLEADDMMSAFQTDYKERGEESIICSSDKDLRTVPGLNYNIGRDLVSSIDESLAKHNFYYQLLCGDPTDNIPSPYGLGEVGTLKFLDPLYGGGEEEYYNKIVPFYLSYLIKKDKQGKQKTPWYSGQDIHKILWEVGNLLWMHRTFEVEERWNERSKV